MRPKDGNVIDKTQPEAGFFESGVKEILFEETHEQISIGGGSLNLGVMPRVEGEMVVGENKMGKEGIEWMVRSGEGIGCLCVCVCACVRACVCVIRTLVLSFPHGLNTI